MAICNDACDATSVVEVVVCLARLFLSEAVLTAQIESGRKSETETAWKLLSFFFFFLQIK